MIKFNESFSVRPDLIVNVERTPFNEGAFEDHKLIAIQNTAYWKMGPHIRNDPLILPKLYAALTHLTGPGDMDHDDYKGSYSFTFKLDVQKNNNRSEYIYIIYHYRSHIEFTVNHIVAKSSPQDDEIMHKPNDELFSDIDICSFSLNFCGYFLGFIKKFNYTPEPFLKYSDSNFLLFGCYENKYFFEQYEDETEYRKEKSKLEDAIALQAA